MPQRSKLVFRRPRPGSLARCVLLAGMILASFGCSPLNLTAIRGRFVPSNDRDWSPEFRKLSRAVISGDQVTIYNIRNNVYITEKDFLVQHYDRLFQLSDVQTVDFIVVPFRGLESIAHTMLSFGLADGTYIAVSVEVRTEKGESYTTALGLSNQFELVYVVADERDVIRLRTRHRNADVYILPTKATPEQAQELFVHIMQRANELADQPEFYDTITNNCTNNLVWHFNEVFPERIPRSWKVLLSGHSAKFAYDLGLLDQRVPFDDLMARGHVNDLAEQFYDDPDFSHKIRSRLHRLSELPPRPANSNTAAARRARPPAKRIADLRQSMTNPIRSSFSRRGESRSDDATEPLEVRIED